MAAPVLNSTTVIEAVPFLIHKLNVTSGNTATALAHGGPTAPDLVFATQVSANAAAGGSWSLTAKSATTITLDFEIDATETWEVYCFFFAQASGGIAVI